MTHEVIVKIISKFQQDYEYEIDPEQFQDLLSQVLYEYNITPKETALALVDDMEDKILLYLATKKLDGLSKNTIIHYGRNLIKMSNHLRKDVNKVTNMDIRMYLAQYSKTGVKNSTLATITDILRAFFQWLDNEDYIAKNPMRTIKTPKTEKRTRKSLTQEQLEILRGGAHTLRQKALLEFLYNTGCRLEEVTQVKIKDINWSNLSFNVIGKGNKERKVYMNATAKVAINNYLSSREDNCEYLFATERIPYKVMGKRAIQREIDKISSQSNIGINIFPHLLRHTFATHKVNSGMDITAVQSILGHTNLSTTQIYAETSGTTIEYEYYKHS